MNHMKTDFRAQQATEEKAEAIALADAHTKDAGLPTYSELVEALRLIEKNTGNHPLSAHQGMFAARILARLPK